MKIKYTLIISIVSVLLLFSQEESDSLIYQSIFLDEVFLSSTMLSFKNQHDYFLLKRKIMRVYPYVDSVDQILTVLDSSLNNFKKKRHTRRYIRKFQNKIMEQFSSSISNLTRQEGVILSKLIYREFNITVYDLINKYRGRTHAFFWQGLSRLYDGNLKSTYYPEHNIKDRDIEYILQNDIKK